MPAAYRTQWTRARKAILSAAGATCFLCGRRDKRLLVHHKVPITAFEDPRKANELHNLMAVCDKCHRGIHSGRTSVAKSGLT